MHTAAACACTLLLGAATASTSHTAPPPNVLFIVVDDLGNAVKPYGGLAIAPNMARLAAKGVQMQRAYVSIAVCAPSRTAFLTGLRPDTTQVWTIGPYFRSVGRSEGMDIVTLPQLFRMHGYNATGAGKIFHPGTPSGGLISSEGGGDMCPQQSPVQNCSHRPGPLEPGSWTEPYWFCDQYSNDTVQSPAMQQWSCALHGSPRQTTATYSFPSCGGGCVQDQACVDCFVKCGTWGKGGAWDACDCPDACYPEGVIADQTIRVLKEKAGSDKKWFHALGFKRPHLTYRAPTKYFDMYQVEDIPLPVHRYPSPSAPPISYSHSCINDNHMADAKAREVGMGGSLFEAGTVGVCEKLVINRTRPEFNGSAESFIEINTNDKSVKELRLAYYAVITLMDTQLGRVLDTLESTGLDNNTIITFIGDHGYQNGEKGEWCKTNNFELATRIPMWVVVPPSLGDHWARGVVQPAVVESLDLYVTIADLAGIPLPKMALGGETMRPLLLEPTAPELSRLAARKKTWALSQWPRRPSCTWTHGCIDGHGNPYENIPDQAIMGYKLRTEKWAYIAWMGFDWGEGGDPAGTASVPIFEQISARELYTHEGDIGDLASGENYEWDNLAYEPKYADVVSTLHAQLLKIVKTGLVKPMSGEAVIDVTAA